MKKLISVQTREREFDGDLYELVREEPNGILIQRKASKIYFEIPREAIEYIEFVEV